LGKKLLAVRDAYLYAAEIVQTCFAGLDQAPQEAPK
jgi:hypothetical protein